MFKIGRRGKLKTPFEVSLVQNQAAYWEYVKQFTDIGVSLFQWEGLPDTVDVRFMELGLFELGSMVMFEDEVQGILCLPVALGGNFNVYNIPTIRRAYAANGYNRVLDENNSVIIYNNNIHSCTYTNAIYWAKRLYNYDRVIDVNINAQKTPVMIQGTKNQRLTLKNMYKEWDGNQPVIYGDEDLNLKSLTVLKTDAPFVADKVYRMKTDYWNEALTYIGVGSVQYEKSERLLTNEVNAGLAAAFAAGWSRLDARRQAAEAINRMFGLNVTVDLKQEFKSSVYTQNMVDESEDIGYTDSGGDMQ